MSSNLPATTQQGHYLPANTMQDIATAGELLAQANFLGTKNAGEGFMVMAACQQRGEDLVSFQQRYHFRQGRFSMQAHEMLAEFERRGGTFEIIERSPERAAIKLKRDGQEYVSSLTWEEAIQEPFVYRGNESEQLMELEKPLEKRKFKAKYRTPRSRQQMMWARVASDGVVAIDPGARGGIYTPEETEDFQDADAPRTEKPVSATEAQGAINVIPSGKQGTQAKPAATDKAETEKPKEEEAKEKPKAASKKTKKEEKKQPEAEAKTETEPDPFEMAQEQEEDKTDYSVCPIDSEKVKGRTWAELPDAWLFKAHEKAGQIKLKQGHINAIEAELKKRGKLS